MTLAATALRLCRLVDLADGRSRGFDPLGEGRDTMFVVRRGGRVAGYRNACPHHDNARMAWKKDEYLSGDGSRIRCGAHGALFRIEDGLCEIGPCLGQRLTPVPLRVSDGEVWLDGPYAPGLRRRAGDVGPASARVAAPPEQHGEQEPGEAG